MSDTRQIDATRGYSFIMLHSPRPWLLDRAWSTKKAALNYMLENYFGEPCELSEREYKLAIIRQHAQCVQVRIEV